MVCLLYFVAGGTGGFFSLYEEDYHHIVEVSVAIVKGHVPVCFAAGCSVSDVKKVVAIAEKAGCDVILLMHFVFNQNAQTTALLMTLAKS